MGITAINVRNQFKGHIKEIIRGSVVSEVDCHFGDHHALDRRTGTQGRERSHCVCEVDRSLYRTALTLS